MSLSGDTPTRKQRFDAALALAGMTREQWLAENHAVSRQHLYEVLKGDRVAGAELNAAIDALIEKYLPSEAA